MKGQNPKNNSIDSKSLNTSLRNQNSQQNESNYELNPTSVTTTQPTVVELPQSLHAMNGHFTALVCTPGLEYLTFVDQLLIKQKVVLFEVLTGCEMKNRYSVQNNLGQNVFEAKEVSSFCDRFCCDQLRPLEMELVNNLEQEAIYFRRPLRCDSCICFCCLQEIQVESPRGNVIGYVIQDYSFCYPAFHIENSLRQTVFKIEGPLITCSCCCNDVDFDVLAVNQRIKVAKISKLWSGCVRETWTDSDYFRVAFPLDLDVNMKAMILSAAFLIVNLIIYRFINLIIILFPGLYLFRNLIQMSDPSDKI